jgi:glycosyltransferase involved in cell wall biosynthesis
MNNKKLLTIVVPTLNRRVLLEETLDALLKDIQGFEEDVELIVINNSSDDDTNEYIEKMLSGTVANFLSFSDRLNIDDSFLRCVKTSIGEFINIFGDDDLPFPGYIKSLLNIIKSRSNLGLIYLNRLIGDEHLKNVGEVAHGDIGLSIQVFHPDEFICKFTHWPGFVTALIFKRDCWMDGEWCYSNEFLGYKFLARVYAGLGERECVYVGVPQLVQRRGIQSWKSEWPNIGL